MLASSLAKAALSAAAVGLLLTLLRHASPRASGLAAAVPINSMPALFWLSIEHGGEYAATAALGSLWGTGLTALLGLTFARLAPSYHAVIAAVLACAVISTLATLIWGSPVALASATALALLAILLGQARQPTAPSATRPRSDRTSEAVLSMGVAGAMSWVVSEVSGHVGAQFGGLIATLPVIGMAALHAGHRQGGAPLMLRVLEGYLSGMLAKAVFLSALWLAWGADCGQWAWALALVCAAAALLAQRNLHHVCNFHLTRRTI